MPSRKDEPIRPAPDVPVCAELDRRLPSPTSGRVACSASAGISRVTPKKASKDKSRDPSSLVRLHCPAAADSRQGGYQREGERYARQHRQSTAHEGLVRAGKNEGQKPAGCRG